MRLQEDSHWFSYKNTREFLTKQCFLSFYTDFFGIFAQSRVENLCVFAVTPRMRRVDWNVLVVNLRITIWSHASHEACGLKSICLSPIPYIFMSRLAWGVWIEITEAKFTRFVDYCHASHEACGLKCPNCIPQLYYWCHASHEACGLKYPPVSYCYQETRHASHEACGLKYNAYHISPHAVQSRLAWGVWIEIY